MNTIKRQSDVKHKLPEEKKTLFSYVLSAEFLSEKN